MKRIIILILALSLINLSFTQDCSNSSILQAADSCYNQTGFNIEFYDCLKQATNTTQCYNQSCDFLAQNLTQFSCPPPEVVCTDENVNPLVSDCFQMTGAGVFFFDCLQYKLYNTPGCFNQTIQNMSKLNIPNFQLPPPPLSNCSPQTVKPIAQLCFNSAGNTTFWFDCFKFQLFNTPLCYDQSCEWMEQNINGFKCPPSHLMVCNNNTVTPITNRCYNYGANSTFFYDCLRYQMFNSPVCYQETLSYIKNNLSIPVPPPALSNCSNATVSPIAQYCSQKTGNTSHWFECMKFQLFNTPNCYQQTCDWLSENFQNSVPCPPPALPFCNQTSVQPLAEYCSQQYPNNTDNWNQCFYYQLFNTPQCYNKSCAWIAQNTIYSCLNPPPAQNPPQNNNSSSNSSTNNSSKNASSNCGQGQYLSVQNNCYNCNTTLDNCASCSTSNFCDQCDPGYFLNITKLCVTCPENQGYYNGVCLSQICTAGQFKSVHNGLCFNCNTTLDNCTSCNSSQFCDQCANGYILNITKLCVQQCPLGYENTNGVCTEVTIKCPPNSYAYNNSCVRYCPFTTFANVTSMSCQNCLQNCLVCYSSGICATCNTGYKISANKASCGLSCPIGQYSPASAQSVCLQCSYGCYNCTSQYNCLQCAKQFNRYTLSNGQGICHPISLLRSKVSFLKKQTWL